MTRAFQSPVNLAYRLESLKKALVKLETDSQPEAEHEARRLIALLRASSEFRGMDSLLAAAHIAEQAPTTTLPAHIRELIDEIQKFIANSPGNTGVILIVSSDKGHSSALADKFNTLNLKTLIADSPKKAREALSMAPVACCIIDVALTNLDGRALILEMRAHPETAVMPVVAISPNLGDAISGKSFPVSGADSVFPKGASVDDIANYLMLRLKRTYMKGLQARRDQVTGLPNRAACHELFQQIQRSIQTNDPMAFILVGIHQFKAIATRCAPLACDEIIRKIGAILSSALRATDVVTRWDNSEFAILLTGEDHFGATKAMEKVIPELSGLVIRSHTGEAIPLTICIGITINTARTSIEDAALRAESHLYMAFSDVASPSGGKLIVSDAAPISHREEPVALCLSNPTMAKVTKQILERETFNVEIFPGIESVLERILVSSFSLLILDDELPMDGGFKLLERLNQSAAKKTLGTMMMVSREESIARVMKLGADDYFLKPPTMPAFLSQIRRIISHNSSLQATPSATIMVVDHELPQLLLAGTTLHQQGNSQILLAKSAADALYRLKNSHPDYLIVDVLLPHISVQEFLNQIRHMEWLKDMKIILARPHGADPGAGNMTNLHGAVSRPFNPGIMLEELRQLIPTLQHSNKGRVPADPRLLELEIQRILALKG